MDWQLNSKADYPVIINYYAYLLNNNNKLSTEKNMTLLRWYNTWHGRFNN